MRPPRTGESIRRVLAWSASPGGGTMYLYTMPAASKSACIAVSVRTCCCCTPSAAALASRSESIRRVLASSASPGGGTMYLPPIPAVSKSARSAASASACRCYHRAFWTSALASIPSAATVSALASARSRTMRTSSAGSWRRRPRRTAAQCAAQQSVLRSAKRLLESKQTYTPPMVLDQTQQSAAERKRTRTTQPPTDNSGTTAVRAPHHRVLRPSTRPKAGPQTRTPQRPAEARQSAGGRNNASKTHPNILSPRPTPLRGWGRPGPQ
mmetsp:Transcript_21487/g.53456  ORF Transcript_21487/g.53456 Transcript_21487/m.53456 type:complete len:268 (-) Transcript_21487:253-1056(-)